MNIPLFTWSCIVGLFVLILLVRLVRAFRFGTKKVLDMGTELEEFYVPGDRLRRNGCEYDDDYEDFDDL